MRDLITPYFTKCNPPPDIPTIILSWAQSLDGCLSHKEGMSTPISSSESLVMTHTIRSLCQGILVGINTVISDDPLLTCRLEGNTHSPVPIILDSRLRIPLTSRILNRSPIICTTKDADPNLKVILEKRGARIEVVNQDVKGSIHLLSVVQLLKSKYGIDFLMVEGGTQVLRGFLHEKLSHLIILTIAPKFFGSGVSLTSSKNETFPSFEIGSATFNKIGSDIVMIGYPLFK